MLLSHHIASAHSEREIEIAHDIKYVERHGLYAFVRAAWHQVEKDHFTPGWHLEEVCKHLEAVSRGECKRLIINIPPGMTKSTITSVLWPAWEWIRKPTRKWMFATFDQDLAFRDALRCRQLLNSTWFRERWGHLVGIAKSADVRETLGIYQTEQGGRRLSVTVGGKGLGWHAHFQVVDDPTNPREIRGSPRAAKDALERTWNWWRGTMSSRRADPKSFAQVIIMQRLHQRDLVGRILNEPGSEDWTVLRLPMEFEESSVCTTKWGGDRREEEGELLCPERYSEADVDSLKKDMGPQVYGAQGQQRPAPAEGNIFKREWFLNRWTELPPLREMMMVQSWDCAFKESQTSDFVAGHVWGFHKGKFYLIDRVHRRMGLPQTCAHVVAFVEKWPMARRKLIEDKANGPAVEQTLREKVPGIVMINPQGGKVARANAVSGYAEAGNVVLPDPKVHPWIEGLVEEVVSFPFAHNDDDVDAMTQALLYLGDNSGAKYMQAMNDIRRKGLQATG